MFTIQDENVQLYHNLGSSNANVSGLIQLFNPWADIVKGSNSYQRIGDCITPRGMAIRLWLATKLDRPNVMFRILVVRVPKMLGGVAVTNSNIQLFGQSHLGACGNNLLQSLDSDRGIKAYYDKVISIERGASGGGAGGITSGKECHKIVKLWIKRKNARDITYDSQMSIIVNNPLVVYVIPYDSYGTLTTDNIASCAYCAKLYYKDV